MRLPNTGAHGASAGRALPRFALTHRLFFFGPELGLYQHSLASQRSILEHVSICSPSQFVHLHGKPYQLFFERELDGTATISVRVIATIGITHGRNTVSPSRNSCDSDPFWSQLTIDVRLHGTHTDYFFRAGARTEPHQLGQISCSFFLYLPPHIGLLLTVRTRFFCTRDRV